MICLQHEPFNLFSGPNGLKSKIKFVYPVSLADTYHFWQQMMNIEQTQSEGKS